MESGITGDILTVVGLSIMPDFILWEILLEDKATGSINQTWIFHFSLRKGFISCI
jgi:hypothetical protein